MHKEKVNKNHFAHKTLISMAGMCLILLAVTGVFAQEKDRQYQPPVQTGVESTPSNSNIIVSADEDYLIGPSDIIEIRIADAPELSGTFRLSSKGTLVLPVVGQITADKKTTDEVSQAIAGKLRGNYLMDPIVAVMVVQSNSRAYFIEGAVHRPGMYQIEGRPTLLKLITIAGGLADNYGSTAFIMREKKAKAAAAADPSFLEIDAQKNTASTTDAGTAAPAKDTNPANSDKGTEYELIKANINNLLRGNFEQNITIELGDIIHIPQSDVFFVAGEVKSPGSFPLKEGTTVRQAISLAQGTNFEGKLDQSVIFREDAQTGQRQEIKIDVGAIMSGKKEDVPIMANDILIVPNSKVKAVTKSILKTITGGLPRLFLGL